MADPQGVSIAFAAAWNVAAPTWTRIDTLAGCRVRSWSIDRGRPNEFEKTSTGTARVSIIDRAGLFDPTNASSPYVGGILPGRQAAIALQNPISDAWFTLFRGYVENWRYRLDRTRQFMELELDLVDGFAILSRAELQVGVDGALPPYTGTPQKEKLAELAAGNVLYGETEGPVQDRIEAILGDVDWPPELAVSAGGAVTDPDVFTGNVRVGPKAYPPGTSALDALFDAVDGEWPGVSNLYMSKHGHVTFHGRQARFRPLVAEYGITHYVVGDDTATAGDSTVVPAAELEWVLGMDNLFNAVSATPQGVGTGTAWRPLNPDAPDNDDVAGQLVEDATSIGIYGRRALTFDNLQTIEGVATGNDSMVETRLFASYYVENYKTPQLRISRLVVKTRRPGSANGAAVWQFLCNIEISDWLTVQTEHPGAGGLDTDFYVEGLHYTARPGPGYPIVELTLDVSPKAHWTVNPYPET